MTQIKIDENKCIGCGACVASCPNCFEMKDNKAVTKKVNCGEPCINEAVSGCPVSAISIS